MAERLERQLRYRAGWLGMTNKQPGDNIRETIKHEPRKSGGASTIYQPDIITELRGRWGS